MRAVVVVLVAACGRVGFAPLAGTDDANATADGTGDGVAHDGAPAAPQLIAHALVNGHQANLTTPGIVTTSASVIVVAECSYQTGAPVTPVDSLGNTWVPGLSFGANMNPATIRLFFAFAPLTGAPHTFTDPGNDYVSIAVLAFTGTGTSEITVGGTGANPLMVGVVGPSRAGQVIASFACSGDSVATSIAIDSGFTKVDYILNGSASLPEDMGSAYFVSVGSTTLTPHWTFAGDSKVAGAIALIDVP